MNNLDAKNKILIAVIALLAIPISGLGIDIYVPSLPAVAHYFNTTQSLAQLTITSYMLGLALMQLFAGSISDSYGRKKPFVVSVIVFVITNLWIPFSYSIYELLALRLVQGMCAAMMVVPMRAVFADLFQGKALERMVTYMSMTWSVGPIIAPALGGYLQHYIGWQANFYFLGLYSTLVLVCVLIYMPETSKHQYPFHLGMIMARYKQIFFHKKFIYGVMVTGLLYSFVVIFGTVAPFLIQSVMHYSAVQFGHIALLMGLSWFTGNTLNRLLINFPSNIKSITGLCIMLVLTIILIMFSLAYPSSIYFVIPIIAVQLTGGTVFPNFYGRSISLFPTMSGSANALFSGLGVLIAAGVTAISTQLKADTALPLAIFYLVLVILSLLIAIADIRADK